MSSEGAYELFRKGSELLEAGDFMAAAIPLERARELEPDQGSIREALGRAYYGSGRVGQAREEFAAAVEIDPVNDYAHFGLALSCARTGERTRAIAHLKLAIAMRPTVDEYREALARIAG